ncbi:hypothetical protein [Pandoraea apista]|uniref:TY-Chap central domain-containing protein n=1 Tax=Pandoraea apista TaxID=93218 RepID=A0ABX9ZUK7_9BURK|nr:hypothetical protein [Pandoraea apista]PTE00693.1 hypothetical protein C7830_13155 [Pandoraea apista]RRJ33255.1 hypothetical protein EIB05_07100 [Pandoraea apista]RRJ80390.1 hypothetical protein EIL82_09625 [Pandoraea apista]RSD15098.1 hypothetical protein EJB12_08580 [Pandoraea apista]RSD20423.1 hypothetical protein EIZ52_09680 [Pandoraea apista]
MQYAIPTLLDYFKREGYAAHLDDDGDIVFKREGMNYALCFDRDDPEFAKLILPNVWHVDTPQERAIVLHAMNEINRGYKTIKIHTVGDQVWLAIEMWLVNQADWAVHMPRAVRALSHALYRFAEQMRTSVDEAREAPRPNH